MKCSLFVFLLLNLSTSLAQDNTTLKVMTYNIKFDVKNDKVNNWNNRRNQLIGLLRYHQPNIFGTQEGLYHQLEDIDSALVKHTYVGVAREDGKQEGEYSAIFYDSSLFNVKQKGNFWLSETPEKPSKGWDAANTRICTWAYFIDKNSDKTFYIFNAHLDHVGSEARKNSVKLILNEAEKITNNKPVVIMGDFNFTSQSEPYKILTSTYFDTHLISRSTPYGPRATFNGFNFAQMPKRRIDYIFVDEHSDVLNYATLSENINMRYPSDHFPVVAEVKLK